MRIQKRVFALLVSFTIAFAIGSFVYLRGQDSGSRAQPVGRIVSNSNSLRLVTAVNKNPKTRAALTIDLGMKEQRKRPEPSGPVAEGFRLSASAEEQVVKSGAIAKLKVRIKNTTKKTLNLAEVGPEKNYKIFIYGDRGRGVPLTEHGKVLQSTEGDFYMNIGLMVGPGAEREDVLEVGNIYDMTLPGNYWIVVRRKMEKLIGKGVTQAESNTVRIQVVKKK